MSPFDLLCLIHEYRSTQDATVVAISSKTTCSFAVARPARRAATSASESTWSAPWPRPFPRNPRPSPSRSVPGRRSRHRRPASMKSQRPKRPLVPRGQQPVSFLLSFFLSFFLFLCRRRLTPISSRPSNDQGEGSSAGFDLEASS